MHGREGKGSMLSSVQKRCVNVFCDFIFFRNNLIVIIQLYI